VLIDARETGKRGGTHDCRKLIRPSALGREQRRHPVSAATAIISLTAILLACMSAPTWAQLHESVRMTRPALLPVTNTENEEDDPRAFLPARSTVVLHEFIRLAGFVKEPEFEALRQWLMSQGFEMIRVVGPKPWRTYPSIKFNGTVGQMEKAFHVTIVERLLGVHVCYTAFSNLLMPARFAQKGENYIEGYWFGADHFPGLETICH
jgi:hypothetical protein